MLRQESGHAVGAVTAGAGLVGGLAVIVLGLAGY